MIKEISYPSACYTPGADLWVVPATANSAWYKKLNWYCSSQLTIWSYKKKPVFSNKLKQIIESETLPFKEDTSLISSNNILVDTANVFPNRAVLALDVSTGLTSWLGEIKAKSHQLKTNKIRIFWGQSQLTELLQGLRSIQNDLEDLSVEVITCEPDKL